MEAVNDEQTRLSLMCELQGKVGSARQGCSCLGAAEQPLWASAKLKESGRVINLDSSH